MYSASDFEKLWFLYKTEGEPKGISLNSFCVSHGVPYTQFNTWFRKTQRSVVPLEVDGLPAEVSSADGFWWKDWMAYVEYLRSEEFLLSSVFPRYAL